jgi:MoaA/NifB/PqqE/SkfB family radical SAM enzyme
MHVELTQHEPFSLNDAARVIQHPETPTAFVSWIELLPLTGRLDRTHLGNLLGWSKERAVRTLGASREVFAAGLCCQSDDLIDQWMQTLARWSVEDFLDHGVPFLRNITEWAQPERRQDTIAAFLAQRVALPVLPVSKADSTLRRDFPDSVIFEITRSCNFACEMCSSRTGGFRADRTMPLEMFGDLVRVLGPKARTVRVNGYGETSIVPNLPAYLDCLDEFGVSGLREIITNLSADLHVYAELFRRGFVILVSWDATTPELFETIRRGSRYDELRTRIGALGAVAKQQPERLGLLMTVQQSNLGEIVPVTRMAADIGAGLVIFNMVKEPDGSPWMDARFEEIRDLLSQADALASACGLTVRIPDHVGSNRLRLPQTKRSSARFCDRPWSEVLVRWDGEMTVCNMFNPFSYGQLKPPGPPQDLGARFQKLWHGPNARLFRQIINSDHPHPYCENCYFLYP